MAWSFSRSRQAAMDIRLAPLGRQVMATVRPRSVLGLVRSRAPLSLLFYVASRDGLIVEPDETAFAVLRRPSITKPVPSGGYSLRLLRRVDRHWDFVVFAGPPSLGLIAAAATAILPPLRLIALVSALFAMIWVCVFLTGMAVYQLQWVARMGAATTPGLGRVADSLPAYHWSAVLVHQPNPAGADLLIQFMTSRLTQLIHADVQASAGDKAEIDRLRVTETLVVLTNGISTESTRDAIADSLRALHDYPRDTGVIVLASLGRMQRAPRWPVTGGGFLLTFMTGLAVVIAVCAVIVADSERQECASTSCAGRPATYTSALRWLLQRLLFSDPAGLSPGTPQNVLLGWAVSIAGGTAVLVALVAGRQEIARNRQTRDNHRQVFMTNSARVLILVVTAGERDAVLEAVRRRVNRDSVQDHSGERTIHMLGSIAGTEIMLAQAGEQGTSAAAGMLITANTVIVQCRPDYVILTGICFGLRPDEGQSLGDVVVARRVQNIDHRKETENRTIRRGGNVGCSPGLLDRFQAGQSTWSVPRVHFGTTLTSNMLVNSMRMVAELREEFPDAIAGEMEGTGVYEATTLGIKPDWIMVKGISDWGYDKDKQAQPLAARNAAEFVTHVLSSGALHRPRTRFAG